MGKDPAKVSGPSLAQRFKDRILHKYFVRCDMSLILLVVIASGLITSKLLLELGLHSLLMRYPLALLVSFFAFLGLIRVWIWYVFCRESISVNLGGLDSIDGGGGGGGGGGSAVQFGGGDSGGGGASGSWAADGPAPSSAPSVSNPSGGGGGGKGWGFDLDFGDDGVLILLVILLVVSIACAGGYLIYAAPHLLPEAAWQATLAGGLARISKPTERHQWVRCVLRSSGIPFTVVFIMVVAVAWVAHSHCPGAVKLAEALVCAEPVK